MTLTYLELLLGVLAWVDHHGLPVGANDLLLHLPVHVHHHVWVLLLHHLLLHGRGSLLVHHLLLAAVHGLMPGHVHGVGAGCGLGRGSLLDVGGLLGCSGRFLGGCLLLFRLLLLLGSGLLLFGLISHI